MKPGRKRYKPKELINSEAKRAISGFERRHKGVLILIAGIGLLCLYVVVWFGTPMFSDPDFDLGTVLSSNTRYKKAISVDSIISDEDRFISFGDSTVSSGNNNFNYTSSPGKIGNYDIRYYCMFPLYEGYAFQINGDYNNDGKKDGKSDGGFGPVQETHSGLGNTIDAMYDADPVTFASLKPFVENPTLYLNGCPGNDHGNHKWERCHTHWDGSLKIREALMQAIGTDKRKMKMYYDVYMQVPEREYLIPALQDLEATTGRKPDQLGPGTVGALYAVYVRWGRQPLCVQGLNSSMSDDEIIDHVSDWAVGKASARDKPRFICQRGIAKGINNGTIDIYGKYTCDGSCGSKHTVSMSFEELFGRE